MWCYVGYSICVLCEENRYGNENLAYEKKLKYGINVGFTT